LHRLTYRSVDSKADLLRCMDKLIGAMKYLDEFVGDLIEKRKLTHEALQKAEWKLWNYKRYVASLDIRLDLELHASSALNTER
jgi:hypothetical protein